MAKDDGKIGAIHAFIDYFIVMSSAPSSLPQDSIDPDRLRLARKNGFRDSFGVPAISIFASMTGFAAIAREAGFDMTQSVATSALVWGMPGQVAMASLHMAGASVLVIFTAVALANLRMLLMVVSGMDMMNLRDSSLNFVQKVLLMHMLAITSWVQLGHVEGQYTSRELRSYFYGFGGMIFVFGLTGSAFGYQLTAWVGDEVLRAILVVTPLYILLMVINARVLSNRFAAVLGGALCPLTYPFIGEWGILFGGIAGGTMVIGVKYWRQKSAENKGLAND